MAGSGNNNESVEANKLASDAILNYKTVASLGYDTRIVDDFEKILDV